MGWNVTCFKYLRRPMPNISLSAAALTKTVIKEMGSHHPPGSVHHPTRSQNSAWIEIRMSNAADVTRAVELIRHAILKQ